MKRGDVRNLTIFLLGIILICGIIFLFNNKSMVFGIIYLLSAIVYLVLIFKIQLNSTSIFCLFGLISIELFLLYMPLIIVVISIIILHAYDKNKLED